MPYFFAVKMKRQANEIFITLKYQPLWNTVKNYISEN